MKIEIEGHKIELINNMTRNETFFYAGFWYALALIWAGGYLMSIWVVQDLFPDFQLDIIRATFLGWCLGYALIAFVCVISLLSGHKKTILETQGVAKA